MSRGILSGGFCPGGFCPGGFCPRTVYKCVVDQNAYNNVSDTFINYKKKLKLSFLVLANNDALI